ncbi:MAG: hypothetical protein ACE5GA_04870, partial [Candidatus Zixiibacteriota bacterium]
MRIHLTQKSIVRRALIGGIALGLLLSAGCQEKILNTPAPEPIQVHLSPLFSSPALNAIVTTWKLTITGDDMEPVVADLEWVDGFVVGEVVNIPAGEDREFTLEGFDAEGNLIYSGVTVATVVSGAIVDVGIDILPVPPLLRFSPPYVELGPPNSITTAGSASLTLKINNTPGLAHLAVSVIYDPVLLALTGIDTGSGEKVIESTVDHFLGVATIDITDLSGNLVDIQGNGELIAMRFQSKLPAPTPDSTEITVSVNDVTADSVTVADIFTDRGFIRLLPSTDTGQNRAPVWASQADTTISEGQTLNLLLTATDPDGTIPALSAVGLPPGGFFQDSGDGSGSFSFT